MTLTGKKEGLLLFFGDLVFFTLALWLTLLLRSLEWPSLALFTSHLSVFAPLFLLWALVFFIADLYRHQTLIFERELPSLIWRAQLVNSLLALLVFYFLPVGLAPKTNLFTDLLLSFLLIWLWRRYFYPFFYQGRSLGVMFACRGAEVEELKRVIRDHHNYRLQIVERKPAVVVFNPYADSSNERLANFYQQFFHGVRFAGIQDFYESIFGRVPLSLVNEQWFLEKISNQPKPWGDFSKRLLDILVGLVLGVLSLPIYPLVYLAIKLEDGGPVFFIQERVGRRGGIFLIKKFRSMSLEPNLADRHVTRAGRWLRRTRLDEVPQLWSVVLGEQSLIGPRPERPEYVELYHTQIPFYDARHLIAPGLSGWAQLYHNNHPHFQAEIEATREKLAYDLYYLKHRSWWLDFKIALKTIRMLLSRRGI